MQAESGSDAYVPTSLLHGMQAETEGLQEIVAQAVQALPEGTTAFRRLQRIGTAVLGQRQVSLQEAAYLVGGLHLHGCSATFPRLNVGFPDKRVRVVDNRVFDTDDDAATVVVSTNIIDIYGCRPSELQDLTLYDFVCQYDTRTSEVGDLPPSVLPKNQRRWLKQRAKAAVPVIHPKVTPDAHGDEYYYVQLLLHRPWRMLTGEGDPVLMEKASVLGCPIACVGEADIAERVFRASAAGMRDALRTAHHELADDIEAMVQRLRALDPDVLAGVHGVVAAGGADGGSLEDAADHPQYGGLQPEAHLCNPARLPEDLDELHREEVRLNTAANADAEGRAAVADMVAEARSALPGRMTDAEWDLNRARMNPHQRKVSACFGGACTRATMWLCRKSRHWMRPWNCAV